MLETKTCFFYQLSSHELYDLLSLRSEVFVVEQNCAYQDVDNKDQKALHILGYLKGELVAYARAFKPGDYFEEASIGRVVVVKQARGKGLAQAIMLEAIQAVEENFNTTSIKLSAQTYLKKFYNNLGFTEKGKEYLEDGIPHIAMVKH